MTHSESSEYSGREADDGLNEKYGGIMKLVYLEGKSVGADISLDRFSDFGDFTYYDVENPEKTLERIADADIVMVNKTKLTAEILQQAKNVKLVCELATGYDNIDTAYCKAHGIAVVNAGHYSTDAVAQHTFALALSLLARLPYYDQFVKSGAFCKNDSFSHYDLPIMEIGGKTWGIVGLGEIGRRVAQIAKAFGCEVIYTSTSGRNSSSEYEQVSFEELLARADLISIHCPLNENTFHLFNGDAFDKMKKTGILINVGRGPVVDQQALYEALRDDKIFAAGLDVLEKEPMAEDNPLLKIQDSTKLIITPHNAWASVEARERDVQISYDNIKAFLNGERRNRIV